MQLKPIEGAESGGVGGFFKGMGKVSLVYHGRRVRRYRC